ncbi:hypothetical protein OUZ56_005508 [Daphnia magna]|uniref:Replication protein A 70 kDa DNA-binding subunit B/D first OB fold domain-containing protein n=1 Tax=Daphnia magna TaxID=35525 RepID=A0ABQ9YTP7_9CRUS|nr:hypothetical protein OUZ56_005508 [Daphnia magna]
MVSKKNEEAESLFGPKTISELNTSCQNWTLTARLVRSLVKPVPMKTEKVNTLNLVFVDETGAIRVEAWRDYLAKWVDNLKVDTIFKLTTCAVKKVEDRSKQYSCLSHPFKIYINEKSHIDIVKMDQKAKDAFANLRFQFQELESLSSASTGTVTDVYGLICDISLDSEQQSIVIRPHNSDIKILVNDFHWMLNDATIKDQLKKNQTVVAIRGVQILEILPNIIKTKLYEDSSLMNNPRNKGILPALMDDWLDNILNSDTDEDSKDEEDQPETKPSCSSNVQN